MKDIYRKNKHSGQPMAIKNMESLELSDALNYLWLDRLITSLYVVLSVSLVVISLVLSLGSVI